MWVAPRERDVPEPIFHTGDENTAASLAKRAHLWSYEAYSKVACVHSVVSYQTTACH
jgi:hypothetical protein